MHHRLPSLLSGSCRGAPLLAVAATLVFLAGAKGMGVSAPERTDEGRWKGTWMYTYRDGRMALWLRGDGGEPELKIRFQSVSSPEAFETDWQGEADYDVAGHPGAFTLDLETSDPDTLRGTLFWQLEGSNSTRTEKGDFTAYRAGDGRRLVVRFDEYARTIESGAKRFHAEPTPVWVFRKASRRLVRWDELPF